MLLLLIPLLLFVLLLRHGYPEELEHGQVLDLVQVEAGEPADGLLGNVQVLAQELQHVQAALPPLGEQRDHTSEAPLQSVIVEELRIAQVIALQFQVGDGLLDLGN